MKLKVTVSKSVQIGANQTSQEVSAEADVIPGFGSDRVLERTKEIATQLFAVINEQPEPQTQPNLTTTNAQAQTQPN